MHKNTLWSRFHFIYSYTNGFLKIQHTAEGSDKCIFRWFLMGRTASPVASRSSFRPGQQLLPSLEVTPRRWGWWERTRRRAAVRMENMVGNKHPPPTRPGISSSHTESLVGIRYPALKIAKPRQRRRIQLHPHPNSPPWWNRTSSRIRLGCTRARMHARSDGNIIHAFLVLLTFPGSVQLLF